MTGSQLKVLRASKKKKKPEKKLKSGGIKLLNKTKNE